MRHVSLLTLAVLMLLPQPARAAVFQVEDVRIEGLQRVSAGTVFAALPVSPGDLIDDEGVRLAVETLFRTGYFEDIRIGREGDVLVSSGLGEVFPDFVANFGNI